MSHRSTTGLKFLCWHLHISLMYVITWPASLLQLSSLYCTETARTFRDHQTSGFMETMTTGVTTRRLVSWTSLKESSTKLIFALQMAQMLPPYSASSTQVSFSATQSPCSFLEWLLNAFPCGISLHSACSSLASSAIHSDMLRLTTFIPCSISW